MPCENFARRGCSQASPKTYTKNRKARPGKVMTQSCEKCCVAALAEAVVAVEAGSGVDDGVGPLELWVEGDAAGGVEDGVEVDDNEMVPYIEVDT
jgi:hypothetical protein